MRFFRQRTAPVIKSVQEALKFTSGGSPAVRIELSEVNLAAKRDREVREITAAELRQTTPVAELMTDFEREKLDWRSKGGLR